MLNDFLLILPQVTPLEIGMYVLLAVFCAAISVFVASCFVYASRYVLCAICA